MAIDPHKIDTDLTLEIDEEDITVSEFSSALDHFLGLVKEVSRHVMPSRRAEWLIKVFPGSAGIGLYGKTSVISPSEINVIRDSVLDGIASLEKGHRHPAFSDRAIEHARGIRKAFTKRQGGRVRIWNQNQVSLLVSEQVANNASKFLDAAYEDYGSIEGKLEVLSGHGKLQVLVYDTLDPARPIKCEISDEDLQVALHSFRNRVEAFGKIRYRRDGVPVSVRVERIVPFPSPEEVPSLNEIRGILKG